MKKNFCLCFIFILFLFGSENLLSQDNQKVPSVTIKDLKNRTFDTKNMSNDGKPFIISFWATWCKPCLQEMNAMNEVYEQWQSETGIKLYAVSIDDSRSSKKVAPTVNGKKWQFEVLLDENSDFLRAMNASHPPHTFLVNGKGEIIFQHIGFAPGDEEELYKQIKDELNKK